MYLLFDFLDELLLVLPDHSHKQSCGFGFEHFQERIAVFLVLRSDEGFSDNLFQDRRPKQSNIKRILTIILDILSFNSVFELNDEPSIAFDIVSHSLSDLFYLSCVSNDYSVSEIDDESTIWDYLSQNVIDYLIKGIVKGIFLELRGICRGVSIPDFTNFTVFTFYSLLNILFLLFDRTVVHIVSQNL